ncbi:MAG: DUF6362 family protein [Methyloligellaceae bacterium]
MKEEIILNREQIETAIQNLKEFPIKKSRLKTIKARLEKQLSDIQKPKKKLKDLSRVDALNEIEQRIIRAYKTLRSLPDREAGWLRVKSNWPEVLREYSDLVGAEPIDYIETFKPTPYDLDDMLIALGWLTRINKRPALRQKYQRVFLLRSLGFSWYTVGGRMNVHETTIMRWRKDAIILAWRVALRD